MWPVSETPWKIWPLGGTKELPSAVGVATASDAVAQTSAVSFTVEESLMPSPSAAVSGNFNVPVLQWTPMRRLLILASLVVFVDTMFFAAIVPLLPGLSDEFGLSKTEAGMLSGSYAAGTLIAAIPAGLLASRWGPRPTTLLGLGVMTVTVLVFAFAESAPMLIASRFLQGVAGACSWAGALSWLVAASPRDRRGEYIGSAMAAAIVGVLVGPAVGAAADLLSRAAVFSAVGAMGIGLAVLTLRIPPPPADGQGEPRGVRCRRCARCLCASASSSSSCRG